MSSNVEKQLVQSALVETKKVLKSAINNEPFWNEFVSTINLKEITGGNIQLEAKNLFAAQVLNNEFASAFAKTINSILNTKFNIVFVAKNLVTVPNVSTTQSQNSPTAIGINKHYRFDNLVIAEFNKTAYNAVQSLLKKTYWNPILISGGVGLGKTHLLHAIGQEFIQNFPNKKVRYVTADEFIRGVYNSLNNQKLIEELKDKYQSYDLLLMDDIQFLANKDKANEILFHIFNHNINNGQIIIMTSDKPINQLNNFEDRMRSRFNSGLVVHIKNPDINTMRQILETKIQQEAPNFNFTKDAINYIINRNSRDIRSLEGHLNQIMFYALNNLPSQAVIDSSVVTKNLAGESQMKLTRYGYDADPDVVITAVCSAYGVDVDSVKSKIRTKKITTPRHVCMYVLRKKFNMPFAQIGSYLGGRDHSTIVEGINKINEYLKKDSNFKIFIENLYKKM